MSTLPVNALIVPDGHVGMCLPEDMFDGEWRSCAALRFFRDEDGRPCIETATEADLEQITSPEAHS